MKFASDEHEREYSSLDPGIRVVAEEFDAFCLNNGLGHAIVTDIMRTPEWYKKNGLTAPKFSWHYVGCAIDFRNRHWNPDEKLKAAQWIGQRCWDQRYEVILKDHGTAPHFHIAYRNLVKRGAWQNGGKKK